MQKLASLPWGALALNTVGGILAGIALLLWSWVRRKVTAWQFKQVFGSGVSEDGFALIDAETRAILDLDFVSFGGPRSNFKTDDCQSNSGNTLALFDHQNHQFVARSNGQRLIEFEPGFDYGLILKIRPSHFPNRVWFACAGIGEWATSGAAWFLANKWQEIRKEAGRHPFAAVIRVRPGQDQSAEMVRFLTS